MIKDFHKVLKQPRLPIWPKLWQDTQMNNEYSHVFVLCPVQNITCKKSRSVEKTSTVVILPKCIIVLHLEFTQLERQVSFFNCFGMSHLVRDIYRFLIEIEKVGGK